MNLIAKTVMTPDPINRIVPAIERIDSLPIPQIPCPDVHPEPNCVPYPTSNPPSIINKGFVTGISNPKSLYEKKLNITGPAISPNIKNDLQTKPDLVAEMTLKYIPLILA